MRHLVYQPVERIIPACGRIFCSISASLQLDEEAPRLRFSSLISNRIPRPRLESIFSTVCCTFTIALVALSAAPTIQGDDAESVSEAEKRFALTVEPLLRRKCASCHAAGGDEAPKGSLDVTTRKGLLTGGDSGQPALRPGSPDKSPLYLSTSWDDEELQMPPKESDRLTTLEREALRRWIEAEAPWPDAATVASIRERYAQGVQIETSGGLSKEWTERRYDEDALWAYRPIVAAPPPRSADHPIDAFIDAALEEQGIDPGPPASPRTLVRRLTFGLTGLPPSPETIETFVRETERDAERAVERLVDSLLASPHYGEQMARHWLDVVRYADSAGFANDFERPNAWRYRDYVVRSFRADKPYDEFVREQIAGDEIAPSDPEALIATGFLRMGPWEQTGMSVARVTRQAFLDDVTDSVGQTFLAHPLQCARCHDHKFDPVPTRDYYSIQAVFATTQFADRKAEWLPDENRAGFDDERDVLAKRIEGYAAIRRGIQQKRDAAAKAWYAERGLPYTPRGEALRKGTPEDQVVPSKYGLAARDLGLERITRKNTMRHQWELDRYRPIAFSVYSGSTKLRGNVSSRLPVPKNPLTGGSVETTTILTGGDPFARGNPVEPGVLSVAAGGTSPEISEAPAGRRTAFARWLTDPDNPLTARVMVNRIWSWHFGRGIAANPNNFGATGARPTHPELLDWLAAEFVRSGWSVGHMHRLIVTSRAYRRASRETDGLSPDEVSRARDLYALFRPRRLTAEEIRDSMLACSGELVRTVGGIPCRPDRNLEAALQPRMIMGTYAPAYQPNPKPEQRNRRTLYAQKTRGLRDPFLEVLDRPDAEKSCELRETSTASTQALALLNSEESQDRAVAFAARLRKECGDDRKRTVRRAFELAFGRRPSNDELGACLEHWSDSERLDGSSPPPPRREYPTSILRRVKEEVTGETFEYRETLEAYETYVHDLQAADVDAPTRALANLCLVLLNANEFLYVD